MLKKIFGQQKPAKEIQEILSEEINLLTAVNAHLKWKSRLQACITHGHHPEGKLDPLTVALDDQCALGIWLNGDAKKTFGRYVSYHALKDEHLKFHVLAGEVVSLVQSKNMEQAVTLMEGDYAKISRKVIHLITELNKEVQQQGQNGLVSE